MNLVKLKILKKSNIKSQDSNEFTFTLVDRASSSMIFLEADVSPSFDLIDFADGGFSMENIFLSRKYSPASYSLTSIFIDTQLYPKPINQNLILSFPNNFEGIALGIYNLKGNQYFPKIK